MYTPNLPYGKTMIWKTKLCSTMRLTQYREKSWQLNSSRWATWNRVVALSSRPSTLPCGPRKAALPFGTTSSLTEKETSRPDTQLARYLLGPSGVREPFRQSENKELSHSIKAHTFHSSGKQVAPRERPRIPQALHPGEPSGGRSWRQALNPLLLSGSTTLVKWTRKRHIFKSLFDCSSAKEKRTPLRHCEMSPMDKSGHTDLLLRQILSAKRKREAQCNRRAVVQFFTSVARLILHVSRSEIRGRNAHNPKFPQTRHLPPFIAHVESIYTRTSPLGRLKHKIVGRRNLDFLSWSIT